MPVPLTKLGKETLLAYLRAQNLWLAWGIGDPTWDISGTPSFDNNATALVNELGRHRVQQVHYVIPDDHGPIQSEGQRYTFSPDDSPSTNLFVNVIFENTIEPTAEIREVGLFINPVLILATLGIDYVTPDNITEPGSLIFGQNYDKIVRSIVSQEQFFYVFSL